MVSLARDGRLEIGSAQLEYRFDGPPPTEAPTIVMLHEGLGCVGLWGDFPARLSDATGMGVFSYSRAGYGKSSTITLPRPISYMHDEALSTLPLVLDRIGFLGGILVGHSDGASIAALYQGRSGDPCVRGLTLIAPHFFVEDVSVREIAKVREAYPEFRPKLARWHSDVDTAFRGWNDVWLDPDFRTWDIRSELQRIDVPVQVIQGTADQYGTAAQVAAAEAGCAGLVETVMLKGVRHSPHREARHETIAAICGFIQRISGEMNPDERNSSTRTWT